MPKQILFRLTIANLVAGWLLQTATAGAARPAVVGAGPAAPGLQKPCPTCATAIGLDAFRASVGSEIIPVIVELREPPGLMRKMAAEEAGRAMPVQELM